MLTLPLLLLLCKWMYYMFDLMCSVVAYSSLSYFLNLFKVDNKSLDGLETASLLAGVRLCMSTLPRPTWWEPRADVHWAALYKSLDDFH